MNDKPVKVDIFGSIFGTLKNAILDLAGVACALLGLLTLVGIFTGSLFVMVIVVVFLGMFLGVVYRNHPFITSLLVMMVGLIVSNHLITIGIPVAYFCVPSILFVLHGLLILPPIGLDLTDGNKYKNSKLYALSALAVLFSIGGGCLVSTSIWASMSNFQEWSWACVVLFLLGMAIAIRGIQFGHRQKEYLIDPKSSPEKWKNEEKEAIRKANQLERNVKARILKRKRAKRFPRPHGSTYRVLVQNVYGIIDVFDQMRDTTS